MQQRTLGIVGGGQLGRMTAIAAAKLGFRTHILTDHADSPACQVTDRATVATYTNQEALEAFAASVDVVTFEFENLPVTSLQWLGQRTRVHPSPDILRIAQNRVREKQFVNRQHIPTAPWREVRNLDDVQQAVREIGVPAILKTAEFGYDGKGQVRIESEAGLVEAWRALNTGQAVLEGFVPFVAELSVIVARDAKGQVRCYPAVENEHRRHILYRTLAPARVTPAVAAEAERIAEVLATASDLVGLLAVELFLCEDNQLVVNELAPRPHNSGHWTLDACATSQFEQLVRAVTGLPLGSTAIHYPAEMLNVLGEDMHLLPHYLESGWSVHIYGKSEPRAGRKMAHVVRPRES